MKAVVAGAWFVTGLLGVCLVSESECVPAMLCAIGWLAGSVCAMRRVDLDCAYPELMKDE